MTAEQPPVKLPLSERMELEDITNMRVESNKIADRLHGVAKEKAAVLDEVRSCALSASIR